MAKFEESEIAASGELCYEKSLLVWGVLYKGKKLLELYKDEADFQSQGLPLQWILLDDTVSVEQRVTQENCYCFTITKSCAKQEFSVKTEEERTLWLSKLKNSILEKRDVDITYSFSVEVEPSRVAEQLNLSGEYLLKIFPCGMALYDATGTIPSAYNCFFHDIFKIQSSEDGNDNIICIFMGKCDECLKLRSENALDITQIIDLRKHRTTASQCTPKVKPNIRYKSETIKRDVLKTGRDLDMTNSGGYFESIGSWLNWRAQRNSRHYGTSIKSNLPDLAAAGMDRVSGRGTIKQSHCLEFESLSPALNTRLNGGNTVRVPPQFQLLTQTNDTDDTELDDSGVYEHIQKANSEDPEYDYIETDFVKWAAKRFSKSQPLQSGSNEEDYYY